jgi:hypothetical protein
MNKPNPRLQVVGNQSDVPGVARNAPSGAERLEYMADLILELKSMAQDDGFAALGGILEVAYQEAKAQARLR